MAKVTERAIPSSTYRIQFSPQLGFDHAARLVPYLRELGIQVVYASPLFAACSDHGYDVTDPTALRPSLGSIDQFNAFARSLQKSGMGLLLDIVPNHMAARFENPWWRDLLTHGQASRYRQFFDVQWGDSSAKIVLPVLGRPYGLTLEEKELEPVWEDGSICIRYHDRLFPVDPGTWDTVLEPASDLLTSDPGLGELARNARRLPSRGMRETTERERRYRESDTLRARLRQLLETDKRAREALNRALRELSGHRGQARSFDALDRLLSRQAYQLYYWRSGLRQLNYRRFFDVSDLVALRTERKEVFEATHDLTLRLIRSGLSMGVRVDHIDGLRDPQGYVDRLRRSGVPYILIEKILSPGEAYPSGVHADGTAGYEFGAACGLVLVDPHGWRHLARVGPSFSELAVALKEKAIDDLFESDLRRLLQRLSTLKNTDRHARDLSSAALAKAVRSVTARLPVYRTYIRSAQIESIDRGWIEKAVESASEQGSPEVNQALRFLRRILLLEPADTSSQKEALAFVAEWQQFTGPAMAKGVEDTALYIDNRLVSLNEVGSHPQVPDDPLRAFHRFCQNRPDRHGLNTTSTHDSKRSEDVRARIHVLSELAQEWSTKKIKWIERLIEGTGEPVDLDEIELLLQTFVGAWPLRARDERGFSKRFADYLVKAAREAKSSTSWLNPNSKHERHVVARGRELLRAIRGSGWGRELLSFQKRLAFHGALNSLSQVVLKVASPGVPDVYQGCELWDLSLVDPDNRRPVDFRGRERMLADLGKRASENRTKLIADLRANWKDGKIKLYTLWCALNARKNLPQLFHKGEYMPCRASGAQTESVCAFARKKGDRWCVIAVPRLTTRLVRPRRWPIGPDVWGSTFVRLPRRAPTEWRDVFTFAEIRSPRAALSLSEVCATFPLAMLVSANAFHGE